VRLAVGVDFHLTRRVQREDAAAAVRQVSPLKVGSRQELQVETRLASIAAGSGLGSSTAMSTPLPSAFTTML
jgi:hypothetical protein